MAKEKVIELVKSVGKQEATKRTTTQHGEIEVACNCCGTMMKIPTLRFYASVAPHQLAKPAVEVPPVKDKEGNVLRDGYTIKAKPFQPRRPLMHKDFGGDCEGTFRTIKQLKPKTHKKSRDRVARGSRKG